MYVNGTNEVDDDTYECQTITYYNQEVWMGKNVYASTNGSNGLSWDEVGFWDRVLTAEEISNIYNSGTGRFYE